MRPQSDNAFKDFSSFPQIVVPHNTLVTKSKPNGADFRYPPVLCSAIDSWRKGAMVGPTCRQIMTAEKNHIRAFFITDGVRAVMIWHG